MNGLRRMLLRDEAKVPYAYQDSLGYWTIGVGHLIDKARGGFLPDFIIDLLLDYDIDVKTGALLKRFPWMATLDEVRKAVMISMAFQLGVEGLSKFKRALAYMKSGEYTAASLEFADSTVARKQTPERWKRHCEQIRTGEWQ
jgi:lysozyme